MFFKSKKINKKLFYSPSFLLGILVATIVTGVAFSAFSLMQAMKNHNKDLAIVDILIEPANAAEIYPEFVCGCCGKPLDPINPCCGDMEQKISYIDKQVDAGLSKDEIMMAAVKEFGVNSLAKEETKQKIKDQLIALAPADAPKIVFEETNYDFGEISQTDGVVFVYFNIKNEGQDDLVIDKLNTSCGCTSASIVYQEQEGPTFTMPGHGEENPKNWSVSIAPGDSAQVKVYYDPNAHGKQKEDTLSITRTISVFSNDPVEFEKQVRIELNQVP